MGKHHGVYKYKGKIAIALLLKFANRNKTHS